MQRKTLFFCLVSLLAAGINPGFLFTRTLNLDYSTYLGGSGYDDTSGISLGTDGRTYITGYTDSSDFPTENPYQAEYGGSRDVFVSVLTSTGSALYYSTYLGGSGEDRGCGISLGTDGVAYVTGITNSSDFPTENPYQAGYGGGGYDAFVSALTSTGAAPYYSTYLGGSGWDQAEGISLGTDGRSHVTGYTTSSDFPTENPYQAVYGGGIIDVFVAALTSTGSAIYYSTYLGGSGDESGAGISLGTDGRTYITGYTESSDFPTENPYQAESGGSCDVFVSALTSTGADLYYSTYLGGSASERGTGIGLGMDGRTYITGYTDSSDFPTGNPYQAGYGGYQDGFVSALTSTGSVLSYSTYLGGSGYDYARAISLGTEGAAYITGTTNSSDFPTENPYQAGSGGSWDVLVTALSSTGSALSYSTYLGGSNDDYGRGISLGTEGAAYITGTTNSSDFPTENPYQAGYGGGGYDAFVSRLILVGPPVPPWIYDYNGDGTSDIAIFRSGSGLWAVRGITRVYFGGATDETVPGDYDGDGTTEISIFRATSGLWAIRAMTRTYFGGVDDLPEPGDYDGDGTEDVGIFRQSSGLWAVRGVTRAYFGGVSDSPAPGYFEGSGRKDIAIFRGSSGLWAIRDLTRIYFGSSADTPVPGDYNGDRTWEAGIFRPTSGLWAIRGLTRIYFGGSSDFSVPADYNGDSIDDIGIFRESSGLWAVRGLTRVYFGGMNDLPVTR